MAASTSGTATGSTWAQVLLNKCKRGAAAYVYAECSNATLGSGSGCLQNLNELLDDLLSPKKPINDWET